MRRDAMRRVVRVVVVVVSGIRGACGREMRCNLVRGFPAQRASRCPLLLSLLLLLFLVASLEIATWHLSRPTHPLTSHKEQSVQKSHKVSK